MALADLLDVCQEKLLTLIEKNSEHIQDQIDYWTETKRESLILYAARKNGQNRLGYQPVPSSKVSETKAKEAIEMCLHLSALKSTMYGSETWTLGQTSREVFLAPPEHCFKKHGQQVTVCFEGDSDKAMPYVQWGAIYYQDEKDNWRKTKGEVNYYGLYYVDCNGYFCYYVSFKEEAAKYGNKKPWLVQTTNGTLIPPDSTSDDPLPKVTAASPAGGPAATKGQARLSFWGSPGGLPESSLGTTWSPNRARFCSTPRGGPESSSPSLGGPTNGFGFGRRGGGRQTKSPERHPRKTVQRPGQVEGAPSGGGGRPACPSCTNPVIVCHGSPNVLKCWRNRCNKGYKHLFVDVTSVYSWLSSKRRGVEGEILVMFEHHAQMDMFLKTVPRPKNILIKHGH